MGDELYLRRLPLPSLATLFLAQLLPGGWGKRLLTTWLSSPSAQRREEEEEEQRREEEEEEERERGGEDKIGVQC
jgi:hypothetical protein